MWKLEFGQHWIVLNHHCVFVTATYCVLERPVCLFVLISVKIIIPTINSCKSIYEY